MLFRSSSSSSSPVESSSLPSVWSPETASWPSSSASASASSSSSSSSGDPMGDTGGELPTPLARRLGMPWSILEKIPKDCKKKLSQLECLKYDEGFIQEHKSKGRWKFHTKVSVGSVDYALYPEYMADPGPYTLNSIALLCPSCATCVIKKIQPIPKYCLHSGFDFSNPSNHNLPELSILEILMIQKCILYGKVAKLFGSGQLALTGHMVSVSTNAADEFAKQIVFNNSLPRLDVETIQLSVTFIGSLDRWKRLIGKNPLTGETVISVLYKSVFKVDYNHIVMWLSFLKLSGNTQYSHIDILPPSEINLNLAASIVTDVLENAVIMDKHDDSAFEAMTRINHPGAPTAFDSKLSCGHPMNERTKYKVDELQQENCASELQNVLFEPTSTGKMVMGDRNFLCAIKERIVKSKGRYHVF